jgi:hypothetical protein
MGGCCERDCDGLTPRAVVGRGHVSLLTILETLALQTLHGHMLFTNIFFQLVPRPQISSDKELAYAGPQSAAECAHVSGPPRHARPRTRLWGPQSCSPHIVSAGNISQ